MQINGSSMSQQQLAAVLAGLRLLQEEIGSLPIGVQGILDADGSIDPITEDEIDELCVQINCS